MDQVKTNAVELLREELSRLEHEVISCGDWQQPAEDRYRLSRGMLEVVRDLGLPQGGLDGGRVAGERCRHLSCPW